MTTTIDARPATQLQPQTMRGVRQSGYGGPEVFSLTELPRPRPGAHEVLVRVRAAGLDRGTWHLMTGRPYLVRLAMGFFGPKQAIPGLDLSGTVVEVGEGVTRFAVGDEVFGIGRGSFAPYACALEEKLARKPDRLSFEQAAVLGVSGLTALQSLEAGALQPGERVLILGASGGVGSYAVQLGRARGAAVTAVCSAAKADLVRALGASEVLDYARSELAVERPFDLILDLAGNTSLSRLRQVLTTTGRLIFVGGEHGGDWTAGFGRQLWALAVAPFVKQRFVAGFMAREHFTGLERLARHVEAGELTPALDRTFALDELALAMRELEAGRVRGKLALRVS